MKDIMKKFLRVLLVLSCIFLCTQWIRADKQWLQNIDFFVNKAITEHEGCYDWKTFIDYDLLGVSINDQGNFEYYVSVNGQWFYIDERWNLNTSCKFTQTPVAVEIAETKTWYALINYQNPKNSLKNDKQIKETFSENAYKNRKLRQNSPTELNTLPEAEKYFWIILDETWNFECNFCDTTRYFYDKIINKNWDTRDLYGTEPVDKKRFIFNSDWTMQRMWANEWRFSRHFWKNNSTIMINDENNPSTIQRFIIEELKDNEMVFFTEYIQL